MQHVKALIYGDPAVGKSYFALEWPNPFFICTDDNYDFLIPFGAKPENHVRVYSWDDFVKFTQKFDFRKYDTIVIDLIEDLYMWCETEYCQEKRIDDLSDVGFGKGYKVVRRGFDNVIYSVINKSDNFLALGHSEEKIKKTKRGNDTISYKPALLSDSVLNFLAGKLTYCFRARIERQTDENGNVQWNRLLSVGPNSDELQVTRGVDTSKLPNDILLDYNTFVRTFDDPKVMIGTIPYIREEPEDKTPSISQINKIKAETATIIEPSTKPIAQPSPKPIATTVSQTKPIAQPKPVVQAKPIVKPIAAVPSIDVDPNDPAGIFDMTGIVDDASKSTLKPIASTPKPVPATETPKATTEPGSVAKMQKEDALKKLAEMRKRYGIK